MLWDKEVCRSFIQCWKDDKRGGAENSRGIDENARSRTKGNIKIPSM